MRIIAETKNLALDSRGRVYLRTFWGGEFKSSEGWEEDLIQCDRFVGSELVGMRKPRFSVLVEANEFARLDDAWAEARGETLDDVHAEWEAGYVAGVA